MIAGLFAASALACATASTPGENQRILVSDNERRTIRTSADPSGAEAMIDAPSNRVWDALMLAYPELGIQVLSINRPAGELGNRNFRVLHKLAGEAAAKYLNCGFDALIGPQANMYPIDASMLTVIRSDSSGATRMETHLSGSARKTGVNADPLYCGTTGALEGRLAEAVRKHITP